MDNIDKEQIDKELLIITNRRKSYALINLTEEQYNRIIKVQKNDYVIPMDIVRAIKGVTRQALHKEFRKKENKKLIRVHGILLSTLKGYKPTYHAKQKYTKGGNKLKKVKENKYKFMLGDTKIGEKDG